MLALVGSRNQNKISHFFRQRKDLSGQGSGVRWQRPTAAATAAAAAAAAATTTTTTATAAIRPTSNDFPLHRNDLNRHKEEDVIAATAFTG